MDKDAKYRTIMFIVGGISVIGWLFFLHPFFSVGLVLVYIAIDAENQYLHENIKRLKRQKDAFISGCERQWCFQCDWRFEAQACPKCGNDQNGA